MLEKITFEKKLGIDSSDKKWRGLKIMSVSFLVALSGGVLTILGLGKVGYWVVVIGVLGGFVGLAVHLYAVFNQVSKRGR